MTETTLKFGPEWLRALSHGSGGGGGGGPGLGSPPVSPGSMVSKYKTPEHRYGREEMLALYEKGIVAPDEMSQDGGVFVEKCQPPVAFSNVSEEEKMAWSSGVNSEAVLRLTGRGGGPAARGGRGGSVDRGRGRGRGASFGFRAGYDDGDDMGYGRRDPGPPGYLRGKSFERSHSMYDSGERAGWGDRNGLDATSPRKELGRGSISDNWRSREPAGGDDRWRGKMAPRPADKWGMSRSGGGGSWRGESGLGAPGQRRRPDDERRREELPEWATESGGAGGSFDSKGEFHGDWGEDPLGGHREGSSGAEEPKFTESDRNRSEANGPPGGGSSSGPANANNDREPPAAEPTGSEERPAPPPADPAPAAAPAPVPAPTAPGPPKEPPQPPASSEAASMQQLQETANNLVAGLMEDEKETTAGGGGGQPAAVPGQPAAPGSAVAPGSPERDRPEGADQWFYTDPQGQVQGSFTSAEMLEWYQSGYFRPNLLVRRGCDDTFSQLGELEALWGRVPFAPGLTAPPITKAKASASPALPELDGNMAAVLQQQQLLVAQQQHQFMQQQLRQQAVAQALLKLQQSAEFRAQPPAQQQQILSQYLMSQHMAEQQQSMLQQAPDFFSLQSMLGKPAVTLAGPGVPGMPGLGAIPGIPGLPAMGVPGAAQNSLQHLLQQMHQQQQQQQSAAVPPPPQPAVSEPAPAPASRASDSSPDPIQSLMQQLSRAGQAPPVSGESVWSGGQPWPGAPGTGPAGGWASREDAAAAAAAAAAQRQQQERKLLEEAAARQREERRALDEARQREEERLRWEEERRQQEQQLEELRRQEQERQRAEEQRRQEEERQRLEEQRRQEEERQRAEEQRRQEEARLLQERQQQEEKRKQEEEAKRVEAALREEKERKKLEKKREEQRKKEERQAQEEALRQQQEEERKREEERVRLEEEEQQRLAQEAALQRLQEQQAQQQRVQPAPPPAQPAWSSGQQPDAPSLSEIQRLQDRDRRERAHREQVAAQRRREQQLAATVQQQQQQQQKLKWAAQPAPVEESVKSLAEIQAEQARELAKRQQRAQAERQQQQQQLTFQQAGVWSGASQNLSWSKMAAATPAPAAAAPAAAPAPAAARAPSAAAKASDSAAQPSAWDGSARQGTAGPWTAAVANNKQSTNSAPAPGAAGFWEPAAATGAGKKGKGQPTGQPAAAPSKKKAQRNKAEQQAVMKLFVQEEPADDGFHAWATATLKRMKADVDVPTFIGFLKDVESPFEVKDYVLSYLGENKEASEFARQFLERRSRWKNATKRVESDDMYGPARAVNPASNEFQEAKPKGRKGKNKNRAVDNSILGFSVTSAEGRLNVGERETIN
ncbi:GRB10-interacting GYF protein 2-like isoform X2 [Amphibalanus amphitrite]|uniref:GRB10-interacting GYF protein 2-like isoform X2 n=1 Tax=Amphibalanus amphitrite TaxID=1232801 RepID=UPI001C909949|nr:GRB10-interacting GYF protein 2-like isoform X2 [Amphibalanus amphitrite]